MRDYTPTTDEVRGAYGYWSDSGPHAPPDEFDRWIKAHHAEVAAQALRDTADVLDRQPAKAKHGLPMMLRADWLRDRANRIEQGGQP